MDLALAFARYSCIYQLIQSLKCSYNRGNTEIKISFYRWRNSSHGLKCQEVTWLEVEPSLCGVQSHSIDHLPRRTLKNIGCLTAVISRGMHAPLGEHRAGLDSSWLRTGGPGSLTCSPAPTSNQIQQGMVGREVGNP